MAVLIGHPRKSDKCTFKFLCSNTNLCIGNAQIIIIVSGIFSTINDNKGGFTNATDNYKEQIIELRKLIL